MRLPGRVPAGAWARRGGALALAPVRAGERSRLPTCMRASLHARRPPTADPPPPPRPGAPALPAPARPQRPGVRRAKAAGGAAGHEAGGPAVLWQAAQGALVGRRGLLALARGSETRRPRCLTLCSNATRTPTRTLSSRPSSSLFCSPLQDVDEAELSVEEAKERKIMKLLLKVKNGTPPQRKSALRQLTGAPRAAGWRARARTVGNRGAALATALLRCWLELHVPAPGACRPLLSCPVLLPALGPRPHPSPAAPPSTLHRRCRQGARLWRGPAVQPDPAAADEPHAGGPGAPPARQGAARR